MGYPTHPEDAHLYPQHLTWKTKEGFAYFISDEPITCCLQALEKERRRLHIDVFAYVVMPDHLHLVVGPSIMPTGEVVRWMKMASGYWMQRLGFLDHTPWARGYWDRAIRDVRQLATAIRYLHANPVKAGLVDDPESYRYSSYGDYQGLWESALRVTSTPLW